MSWEQVKLEDISISVQTGPFGAQLHQSDYSNEGIPVVMPKDIINGRIVEVDIARVSQSHIERLSRYVINEGDILYSRRGDVGRCAYVTKHENGWLCGTGCLKITLNQEIVDPLFVFYQLQLQNTVEWVKKHAVGATMLNLNTSILQNVPLRIPKLETQHRIADILSAYDDLIENNKKQIKLLEEAAQRLYKEWFVDLHFPGYENTKIIEGIPEGWKKSSLEEICELQETIISVEELALNCPYIGLEHMPRKDFCLASFGQAQDSCGKKYFFEEDDIIFAKIRPYFHKVGFAITSGVVSLDSFVIKSQKGFWGLLLMTMFSEDFVNYSYRTCKEGAKMPRADWNQMKKYYVKIPDDQIRKEFEENIWSITRQIKVLAFQNKNLLEARDRLLSKLIQGEIDL